MVVSALVVGRVRQRVTAIATATSTTLDGANERITDALARLFDLELALAHFDLGVTNDTKNTTAEADPLRALVGEASLNIRNALGVIETSAYLVRRYGEGVGPGHPKIEHHLGRISKHVRQAHQELARLVEAARLRSDRAN